MSSYCLMLSYTVASEPCAATTPLVAADQPDPGATVGAAVGGVLQRER